MPKNKLVFSKGNEVLIPRVGEDPYDYNHCTWLSMPNVAIGEMISIYYTKQNPLFTAIMYNATLRNEFAIRVEGGSVTNLYYDKLKDIDVSFPNKEEQEKISTFFYKIDNLITLHQSKCNNIQVKNKINIRYNDITWEQRKLGDISEIVGGGTPSTNIDEYWNGDINWYSPAEIGEQIIVNTSQRKITKLGLEKSSAKMLPKGTVLFTSRAGIGNTAILGDTACTNQGFQSIVPDKEQLDSYFIFSRSKELKDYGERVGAGSTFVEVSGKQMSEMELLIPDLDEQKTIGCFFERIDNLITLHQHK